MLSLDEPLRYFQSRCLVLKPFTAKNISLIKAAMSRGFRELFAQVPLKLAVGKLSHVQHNLRASD